MSKHPKLIFFFYHCHIERSVLWKIMRNLVVIRNNFRVKNNVWYLLKPQTSILQQIL